MVINSMISHNDYYIVADKKTYPTKESFVKEIVGTGYLDEADKEKVESVWLRYSGIYESYVLAKPNKRGAFEAWEYQYN